MEKEAEKILIAKLRQPIHIGYISQYILKLPVDKTREIINKLILSSNLTKSLIIWYSPPSISIDKTMFLDGVILKISLRFVWYDFEILETTSNFICWKSFILKNIK